MKVLLSTDALKAILSPPSKEKFAIAEVMGKFVSNELEGFVAYNSLCEVYELISSKLGTGRAIDAISEIKFLYNYADFNESVFNKAMQTAALKSLGLEMSLNVAYCKMEQIDGILVKNRPSADKDNGMFFTFEDIVEKHNLTKRNN